MSRKVTSERSETEELIDRARQGDDQARQGLLARHRDRLLRMVAVRLDRRLVARLDPSDVVQEILFDASRGLDEYLEQQPVSFYAWLRQFAWNRLVDLHRHHVRAHRRSVACEAPVDLALPDESAVLLMHRLMSSSCTSPSRHLIRDERRAELRLALAELAPRDREVLVMRHLEQMAGADIAAVLGITEAAAKSRLLRAVLRLRALLEGRL